MAAPPAAIRQKAGLSASGTVSASLPADWSVQIQTSVDSAAAAASWSNVATATLEPLDSGTAYAVTAKPKRDRLLVRAVVVTPQGVVAASAPSPVNVVGSKVVALTFDDGPSLPATLKVLDTLQHFGIRATFFESGRLATRHKKVVRQLAKAGMDIGSHGATHANLTTLSGSKLAAELAKGRDILRRLTGHAPVWIRPPYGAMNDRALAAIHDAGMHGAVWTVDTRDWTGISTSEIFDAAVGGTGNHDGSIVLMHDSGMNQTRTPPAVPLIIAALKKKGFDFVTLDELNALGGFIPEVLGGQPIRQ